MDSDSPVVTLPPLGRGAGLHHTMAALKLQQVQHNVKKIFLRRPVFPMLLWAK